ncbi:hypothetical protein [Defluviitalea raffinosedens]|uniref:hypothetical protein n=1 Tax=Defluviitalea raffinosedens TaxID=1450156 RepID=UPI00195CDC5C|nr:hypothetical protein [Defluviitalea raffinosedens]MBM7684721.1 hypothetical protein [Defluviitalea raffinosedens]
MSASLIPLFSVLIIVILNIMQIKNHPNRVLRSICLILFTFTGLRYVALIVFRLNLDMNFLKFFSYFYYASSIGLTIPTIFALWYIIPAFRERIKEWTVLTLSAPFSFFYLYLIYLQPVQIIKHDGFGYRLQLLAPWNRWLSIVQGIVTLIVFGMCFYGFRRYKYKFPRSQYLLFILGYVLTTIDGLCMLFNSVYPIEPFIFSEAFILIAILYAFATKPIKEKYSH